MALTNQSAIEGVLAQMRAIAATTQALPAQPAPSVRPGGFAAELNHALERLSAAQDAAAGQARAFQAGVPGVSLNDVMIDLQKAGLGFQAAVQVRNRLVAAYQEIASMPV